jgi:hypothetical protein
MKFSFQKMLSVSVALCITMSMGLLLPAAAESEESLIDSGLNYTEDTNYDATAVDCGYTSTIWISAAPGKYWNADVTRYTLLLIGIGGYSSGMNEDGVDYDFDEAFFTSLENALKSARENGTTVGLRFRYDDKGATNPEPADFSQVLHHIEQIGESGLLEKYEECISFVETGMVGSWGEQWGGKYTSLSYKAQVLDAFLNITPDSIPVTVRTPNTVRQWLSDYCGITTTASDMSYEITDPELAAKADRIGLYNDGYMGSDSDLGTFSNREGETQWLSGTSAYGGEFSGADAWRMKYTTWQPVYALPEMYRTHLLRINSNLLRDKTATASFSTQEEAQAKLDEIDALYESAGLSDFDYAGTITESDGSYTASWKWMGYDDFIFDAELDAELGVDCDNTAFYGQTVWQFMRAHLGYRFVLRDAKLSASAAPGEKMTLQFSVENTGFSAPTKDKEVEVLLTNGTITYTYPTALNAADWESASLHTENLDLNLPENMPGGEWKVYLRISGLNADAADDTKYAVRFANADLQYDETLAANYVGRIAVSGEPDALTSVPEDHRPAGAYEIGEEFTLDETTTAAMLDKVYTFKEDGHYGFTILYRIEGITEPLQLGNWYAGWSIGSSGYSSAYTTYGLNTMNLSVTEDGYYALHIPFYGAAFNCTGASVGGETVLKSLTLNDDRNYWSEDTCTLLNGNSNVKITPIALVEGGPEGYDVTFHMPEGDISFTGSYGFEDTLSQRISNVSAVTVLSLPDVPEGADYVDEDGNCYKFLGFTTREGDKSCLIDEDFPAIGTIELYPCYELDKSATDLNSRTAVLTNGADEQGVRYILHEETMTATVGDGSGWENNAGLSAASSIILPAYVEQDGKTYQVTAVKANAFAGDTGLSEAVIPDTVTEIGEGAFYTGTVLYVYENGTPAKLLADTEYTVEYLEAAGLCGDVNVDGNVNILDVILINRNLLGSSELSAQGKTNADTDLDGTPTATDALNIMKYVVKLIDSLPVS